VDIFHRQLLNPLGRLPPYFPLFLVQQLTLIVRCISGTTCLSLTIPFLFAPGEAISKSAA